MDHIAIRSLHIHRNQPTRIIMSASALEKIQAIQDRANKEIESLKAEALSDVVKKLSEAKSAVALSLIHI